MTPTHRALCCLASLVAVTSCWAPQHRLSPGDIRPLPAPPGRAAEQTVPGHVRGIRESLKADTTEPIRVLTVHGMLTADAGFSLAWQRNLGRELGLEWDGVTYPTVMQRRYFFDVVAGSKAYSTVPAPESELRETRWHVRGDPFRRPRLVYYELLWAPYRDAVKNWFLACFEDRDPPSGAICPGTAAVNNRDRRALGNRWGKEGLLVAGVADAPLVLSDLADVLRDDLDRAMCRIALDALAFRTGGSPAPGETCFRNPAPPADVSAFAVSRRALETEIARTPFFVISHSLGGFFIMDGQMRAAQQSAKEQTSMAYALLDDATAFMMANQVGLLGLGRLRLRCQVGSTGRPCAPAAPRPAGVGLFSDVDLAALRPTHTTYVAFNDVNDLLDFELPPYLPEIFPFGPMVNVSARNPGFRIPWLFKNPGAAHTRYHDNPAVIRAIADGITP
jgi:hypothetical protein